MLPVESPFAPPTLSDSDTGDEVLDPEPCSGGWTHVQVTKRALVSHLVESLHGSHTAAIVQVRDADGVLLSRDSLGCPGDRSQVWFSGSSSQGFAIASQSCALPVNVAAFLRPSVSREGRLRSLVSQGVWVSDDQMRFGLDAIAQMGPMQIQVIDPVIMQRLIRSQVPAQFLEHVRRVNHNDVVISAFLWITMCWKVQLGRVVSWASPPPGAGCAEVSVADWLMSKATRCRTFVFEAGIARPLAPGLCGHFALADLASCVCHAKPLDWDQVLDNSAFVMASFSQLIPDLCRASVLLGGTSAGAKPCDVIEGKRGR